MHETGHPAIMLLFECIVPATRNQNLIAGSVVEFLSHPKPSQATKPPKFGGLSGMKEHRTCAQLQVERT